MTASDWLQQLPRFASQGIDAYRPGLERMCDLLERMDSPEKALRTIHVAGTNGKGSTASMIAAILQSDGYSVGLHTSPHLLTLRDRMRINGTPAPESWLAAALDQWRGDISAVQPSFFEATVALALRYFAEKEVEVAVVEVGLGGRIDATNVITPNVSVITAIDYDHTEILGDTLEEIATEKAGIIKPGVPCVSSADQRGVQEALKAQARCSPALLEFVQNTTRATWEDEGGTVETPERTYHPVFLGLEGEHQRMNARLAIRAVELFAAVTPEATLKGLSDVVSLTGLRGRFEVVQEHPAIVCDVAHNEAGVRTALQQARQLRPEGRIFVSLGLMKEKAIDEIAQLCSAFNVVLIPVTGLSKRAVPVDELSGRFRDAGVDVRPPRSAAGAIAAFEEEASKEDVLLATGSHQVVAAILSEYATS